MSTFLKTTSTMSLTKCVINLKKPNDTDNKEQVCSFHHLSSIGKSHFSHQRNHRISPLSVSSSINNQKSSTVSTTINQTNSSFKTIDLKIRKANEAKKLRGVMKREKNVIEIEERHQRFLEYKMKVKVSKKERAESKRKLNQLRKLKLKIFNILSKNTHSVCDDYQRKNNALNLKIFEFMGGEYYKKKALQLSSIFRFDKNENGESHNRKTMIVDIDKMKRDEAIPDKILMKELTTDEKKLIIADPNYFVKDNRYKNSSLLKPIKLSRRLLLEEEENESISKRDTNFTTIQRKPNQKKKIISTSTEQKLDEIQRTINKTVYFQTTSNLHEKRAIKPYEYYDRTVRRMNYQTQSSFAKIREPKYSIPQKEDKEENEKIQKRKEKMMTMDYQKVLAQFNRKNSKKESTKNDDDEYKGIDLNIVFSTNNFKPEEKEFINKYNRIIKNELLKQEYTYHSKKRLNYLEQKDELNESKTSEDDNIINFLNTE